MEYHKQLAYMAAGDVIEGFYLLKSASVRTAANGKPYLNAVLADASGTMEAKMWDFSGKMSNTDEGRVVKVRGEITEFRENLQMNIRKFRFAESSDSYVPEDLVPTAPIDSVKEMEYVQDVIASMEDTDFRKISEVMLDRHLAAFGKLPAAKNVHHSFLSGLLMHTSSMLRIADFLATEIYPTVVNRIGHLVLEDEEITQLGREMGIPEDKLLMLRHMVLSHHGKPEYGAAVIPCIAEAELLSYIDLIDSRMEIYAENLETIEKECFSDKIFSLEKKIYNHGLQEE